MSTTATTPFSDVRAELLRAGYRNTHPTGDGWEIDHDVCTSSACPECGTQGMEYHPFTKPDSYRAFAVCPRARCGHYGEF